MFFTWPHNPSQNSGRVKRLLLRGKRWPFGALRGLGILCMLDAAYFESYSVTNMTSNQYKKVACKSTATHNSVVQPTEFHSCQLSFPLNILDAVT